MGFTRMDSAVLRTAHFRSAIFTDSQSFWRDVTGQLDLVIDRVTDLRLRAGGLSIQSEPTRKSKFVIRCK